MNQDHYNSSPMLSPADAERPYPAEGAPQDGMVENVGHKHNHWMHVLMCAPMLAVVAWLVLTGRAGGGAILGALACVAMMGVMMAMMPSGSHRGRSGH